MAASKRRRWKAPNCFYCEIPTEPVVIYRRGAILIRGWRCPRCGFTLLNPSDIKVALRVVQGHEVQKCGRV